jgi:uncharacterized membrane protein YfcA
MWFAEFSFPPDILILIIVVFLLAGFIKGAVGLGLPTVSLALLTATVGLKEAIALMLIPAIATNIFQSLNGPYFKSIVRRLWLFLLPVCIGVWAGAGVLAVGDAGALAALLGIVMVVYATLSLTMAQIPPPGRWEPLLNPLVGLVAGVMTGLTGSFVVPGSLYLQALNMGREELIQSLGISFSIVTVALFAAMSGHGMITPDLGLASAIAVIPAGIGMTLGTRLRRRLPEAAFRRTFFSALLIIGLYITAQSFLS